MSDSDLPLWFNPVSLDYKNPYGAVSSQTDVTFTLRPRRNAAFSRATLIVRWEFEDNRISEIALPWIGWDGDLDLFSGILSIKGYVGLIWYSFRLETLDGRKEESREFQLTVYDCTEKVPTWFGEGVSYQIFPDRFYRLSVPDPTGLVGERTVHASWDEEPEYRPNQWGEVRNRDFFGGSLAGIIAKLPHLEKLGVRTIYLCPIFEAAENHRYGTADYEKIDPMLGTLEDFTALCEAAHARNMRIMLDGVFNHTGFVSKYFNGDGFYPGEGAYQSQTSPYYDWFHFQDWPYHYESWWGIYSLPATNKNSKEWLNYITGENGIIRSWLRAGADGWRLDVADELPDFVVHAIHSAARAEKPDAVIIGEVWEDGSNKISYSIRRHHLLGGYCDGLMNYPFQTAVINFLQGGDAEHFQAAMETLRENYPPWAFASSMNALGTHDTPRILTLLGVGSAKKEMSRDWRSAYRMTDEEWARGTLLLKMGALILYAFPGSPTVYYGDEAGLEGFEDPFNRRTYPWGQENADLMAWYASLGKARNESSALQRGDLRWLKAKGRLLAFERVYNGERAAALVNASEKPAVFTLPWGLRVSVAPMTGKLLRLVPGREMITIL